MLHSLALVLEAVHHQLARQGVVHHGPANKLDSSWNTTDAARVSKKLGKRLDRRLEEVAKVVGGGYCRLHMPLKLALAVRETVAEHRLGALEVGEGCPPPLFQCIPGCVHSRPPLSNSA